MSYVASEARQELLHYVAEAIDEIARALAELGAAYELLDERAADAMEEELFRPAQLAYGRAKRTHSDFAARYGLVDRTFAPGSPGAPSRAAGELLGAAGDALAEADTILAQLQDSLKPVEVGDTELRAGLAEVRTLLGDLPARAERLRGLVGR